MPSPANKQNMSNCVLAFAKLEYDPGDEVLSGLAGEALLKIRSFTPQVRGGGDGRRGALSSFPGRLLCCCIGLGACSQLPHALPLSLLQALSNTLWGLSKLGIQADELMEGLGREARAQLYEFNSQNLANSVRWGTGVPACPCWRPSVSPCLLAPTLEQARQPRYAPLAPPSVNHTNPQVWAYANIGVNPGDDLMQVRERNRESCRAAAAERVCPASRTAAGLAACTPELLPSVSSPPPSKRSLSLQDFARTAIQKMPEFSPQVRRRRSGQRSLDAAALRRGSAGEVGLTSPTPLSTPRCPPPTKTNRPQNISNMLWAFSKLGVHAPALFAEGAP